MLSRNISPQETEGSLFPLNLSSLNKSIPEIMQCVLPIHIHTLTILCLCDLLIV